MGMDLRDGSEMGVGNNIFLAMGTKMAVAFANILMARIEDQILRQSCIEPHPGNQRIFLGCGGML